MPDARDALLAQPPRCTCPWGDGPQTIADREAGKKPKHIRLEKDWNCPDHGVPAGDWRNDPTIVRPEL